MKYKVKNVKEYLEAIPAERKPQLKKIIKLIKGSAPKVREVYHYNLPFYPLNGEPLFAVASQKDFMALYVTEADIIARYKKDLGKVSLGKSCIRFKKIDDLNLSTVQKILKESYLRKISET